MTPADRRQHPVAERGRSQARGAIPAPVPPSPDHHTGPGCAYCANLDATYARAYEAHDMSRMADIRVLTRRHMNAQVVA